MAVQDFKDPDTTVNEFSNNLSAEQVAKNKEQLLSGIASIGYDLAPVTGELRSLQYAQDEARKFVESALSKDPDKMSMVAQGLGIGLGVLGAIPIVGYGTRIAGRGLQKLYEAVGPGSKADEVVKDTLPTDTTVTGAQAINQADIVREQAQSLMRDDIGFANFVAGLPEYRRTTFGENLREYQNLTDNTKDLYRTASMGRVSTQADQNLLYTERQAQKEYVQVEKEKEKLIKKYELAVTKPSKGRDITTVNEPFTFGQGTLKNQGVRQAHVREFIGSQAYDVIAATNIDRATPDVWIGFLRNARQKGVKAEELADAGLITFNSKGEHIGGELHKILRENPKTIITKQEILASIETNPAFNMKVMNYEFPVKLDQLLEIRVNQKPLVDEVQKIISKKVFETTNLANRSAILATSTALKEADFAADAITQNLRADPDPKEIKDVINKLEQLMIGLPQNESLIVRNVLDGFKQINQINSNALKLQNVIKSPRHTSRPIGGMDYREKVIYYDNPIPDNSSSKRVYSSHFPEANPVAFSRYDVRGVDSYGDTFFLFEVQSDPHQNITRAFSKLNQRAQDAIARGEVPTTTVDQMIRNNPFANKISSGIKKNEKQKLINELKELTDIATTRPLTDAEMTKLTTTRQNLKMADFKTPEPSLQKKVDNFYVRGENSFNEDLKSYDFFPMEREETWAKLSLKSIINSAQKEGKRYVALAPAEFFQLGQNNKFKIEQFYGLGTGKLDNFFNQNIRNINDKIVFRGGSEGIGKYRENTAIKTGPNKQEGFYQGKLAGTAVLPKLASEIVKELGGNLSVKKVFITDPKKPYKILENSPTGKRPKVAFRTKKERDTYSVKYGGDGGNYNVESIDDPINYVESIVIDTQGMKKTPSKGYKLGGLVEVKREFFAPLI